MESLEVVKIAVEAMRDKKAENIKVIDISEISVLGDYFVITDGSNERQVQAILDGVEDKLAEAGLDSPRIEGHGSSSWILMDYGDVIIHIFAEEDREFYNLDKIWSDGKVLDI